jgi:hypothetical protein
LIRSTVIRPRSPFLCSILPTPRIPRVLPPRAAKSYWRSRPGKRRRVCAFPGFLQTCYSCINCTSDQIRAPSRPRAAEEAEATTTATWRWWASFRPWAASFWALPWRWRSSSTLGVVPSRGGRPPSSARSPKSKPCEHTNKVEIQSRIVTCSFYLLLYLSTTHSD